MVHCTYNISGPEIYLLVKMNTLKETTPAPRPSVRPWCQQQHEDRERSQRHGRQLQRASRAAVGDDDPTAGEGLTDAVGGAEGEGGVRGSEDEHLDEALADGAIRRVEEGEAGVAAEGGRGRQRQVGGGGVE